MQELTTPAQVQKLGSDYTRLKEELDAKLAEWEGLSTEFDA